MNKKNQELEIAKIQLDIAYMKKRIEDIHKKLLGNGTPGLISEWNQLKGSISTWKFISTAGIILSILNKFFK